jgi:hypothetical protein
MVVCLAGIRTVTEHIQRKIESLFVAFLNLYCLRLPVIFSDAD